jgi:hypothetical protein
MLNRYKDNISVTIDREVKSWLIDWCNKKGITLSEGLNFILHNVIKSESERSVEPILIKCSHCCAEYSSKLGSCPACGGKNV